MRKESTLNVVIKQIGANFTRTDIPNEPMTAPDPEDKIKHNHIIIYKPIIEEYKVYQGKLNKIYEEIERQGSAQKELILSNIRSIYLKEKGKYKDISEIQENADSIIEKVDSELWKIIENSSNTPTELSIEAIKISILIIIVDAFMRCDILEEPLQI